MIIRRAVAYEAQALSELALRSKAHWGYDAQFMARCAKELTVTPDQIEANPTFVVIDDGPVLGFYALERVAMVRMELNFLFVEPTAIGRGYGRALMEHAKRYARGMGIMTLEIQGDPNASRFYRCAGARQVGARPSASVAGRMLPMFELDLRAAQQVEG
jgi:GNAT superfamily N-acetyltransferase